MRLLVALCFSMIAFQSLAATLSPPGSEQRSFSKDTHIAPLTVTAKLHHMQIAKFPTALVSVAGTKNPVWPSSAKHTFGRPLYRADALPGAVSFREPLGPSVLQPPRALPEVRKVPVGPMLLPMLSVWALILCGNSRSTRRARAPYRRYAISPAV